jgi:hypothetical protein
MSSPISQSVGKDAVGTTLLTVATGWCLVVLLVGSLLLAPQNGAGVAITLSVPLVLVGLFTVVLRRRRATDRHGPGAVAWTIAGLMGVFSLLGILTIGVFVLPIAVLLIVICARAQERRPIADLEPPN